MTEKKLSWSICAEAVKLPATVFNTGSVFMSREYFSALESNGPSNIEYRYVSVFKGSSFRFLYYFQVIRLSFSDISSRVNEPAYKRVLSGISALLGTYWAFFPGKKPNYLLVCGNMCVSGDYGYRSSPGYESDAAFFLPEAFHRVQRELETEGKVVAEVFKDIPARLDNVKGLLGQRRFFRLNMDPLMKMELPSSWKSIEDYVAALSSKYRQRFQQAMKKTAGMSWRSLSAAEMRQRSEELGVLYAAVQSKAPLQLADNSFQYLIALKQFLGAGVSFEVLEFEGRILAFVTGVSDGANYEAHHIGIDYHFNKSHALYLNILYRYIRLAIEAGASTLCFGRTAIEMKTTVGAVPVDYHAYIHFSNGFFNGFLKWMVPDNPNSDWIPRSPFKENLPSA